MQRRMPAYMDRSAQSNQARSVCGSETTEYKASRHRPEAGMTRRPSRQDNTLGRCCRHTRPLSCPCSVAPSVCSCLVPSRPDLFSGALRYGSLVHGTTTSTRNFRGNFITYSRCSIGCEAGRRRDSKIFWTRQIPLYKNFCTGNSWPIFCLPASCFRDQQ